MRLDLVLKLTGLIKRRTVAKEMIDRGHILINDRIGKPASEVKDNDVIELHLGNRTVIVEITYIEKYKRPFPTFKQLASKKGNSDA